jgi:cytochrome c551/c552
MFKSSLFAVLAAAILLAGCSKKENPAPAAEPPPMASTATASAPSSDADPTAAAPATDAASLLSKNGCMACHAVDQKRVGPAYSWVAYRFKGDKQAVAKLAAAVRKGSSGQWTAYTGNVPMPPHPQLSDADIKTMVEWVLKQPPVQPPKV